MKPPEIVCDPRPWGWFTQYAHNEEVTVKIITVMPGEKLSTQKHRYRDEVWIPLDVGLELVSGDQTFVPTDLHDFEVDPVLISRGTVHSARNIGKTPCRFLEVSFGHFHEDDIERLDDKYGRS